MTAQLQSRQRCAPLIKADFDDLKAEAHQGICWTLRPGLRRSQLFNEAQTVQAAVGTKQSDDDFNEFEDARQAAALKSDRPQVEREGEEAASRKRSPGPTPTPSRSSRRCSRPRPIRCTGRSSTRGKVVEFQPDSNLRDYEDVPLTAETARGANVNRRERGLLR